MVGGITVGTLNIGGVPRPRPPLLPLAQRAGLLCRRLDEMSVDVLNLQEVFFWGQLRLLREGLRSFPHMAFRPQVYGPAGGLVTFSRLPLRRPTYRSFIGVHATMGRLRFRLRHLVNAALHGVLVVDLAQLPVSIANTHLVANKDGDWSARNRHFAVQRAQLARLNAVLARPRRTELMVVTGDFNIASDSTHYPRIVGVRRDPFADTDLTTFHATFLAPGQPPHRIDYVLVDGDEQRYPVLDAASFFGTPDAAGYLTDHVGLMVEIALPSAVTDDPEAGHA